MQQKKEKSGRLKSGDGSGSISSLHEFDPAHPAPRRRRRCWVFVATGAQSGGGVAECGGGGGCAAVKRRAQDAQSHTAAAAPLGTRRHQRAVRQTGTWHDLSE